MLTMTYEYGDGLYVNPTNRCNCACIFCIRKSDSEEMFNNDLWLEREPSREELLESILNWELSHYGEIVFCGFGEPSYRIDDILWICDQLRSSGKTLPPIRLNTNGHGSLINGRNICPDLKGRLDRVSISLNASEPEEYCHQTRPQQKEDAFYAMLDFAKDATNYVPEVVMTIVDFEKSPEEIKACYALTEKLGVELRIRTFTD